MAVSFWMHQKANVALGVAPATAARQVLSVQPEKATSYLAAATEETTTTVPADETPTTATTETDIVVENAGARSLEGDGEASIQTLTEAPLPENIDAASLIRDTVGVGALTAWNPEEFEQLAAPDYETTDRLAQVPNGTVIVPPQLLSVEELLAADRSEEPIGYGTPLYNPGTPFRLGTGTPGVPPIPGPVPPGRLHVESTDFLDYDEEHNHVYGQGRITVRYGQYKLEADRMMIDTRLQELQAYGNVILSSPTEHVTGESVWFNLETYQGVAYEARGHTGDFFVLPGDPHCDHGTEIRQVSRDETVLKDSSFTTCDFPVPHYRLRAKEFTIIANERIFAKNVVLYVLECPVLWLPYFTRALQDANPFGITAGADGELGFFVRLFYDFHHHCYTPSDVDDNLMIKSSKGAARLRLDLFTKRGIGKGLAYEYFLDYGKHKGALDVYHLTDRERNVDDDSGERYYANWFHRTHVTDELDFFVDIDYASDPDIFYDVLDRVRPSSERRRGRLDERHVQTGFEWTADDFYAGLQVELKDRIGRDRVSNFADFRDNDFDYDRGFNNEEFFTLNASGVGPDGQFYSSAGRYSLPSSIADDDLEDGVASDRYGRVTQRLPHLRVSSNRMRLWRLPLWYHVDLNVFNNLDKGLNVVGTDDDAFVRGFDLYQSISHLQKFCDRYTLLTKYGLGVGVAAREEDSYNLDFPSGATFPFVYDGQLVDGRPTGLTFVDEDTFLVGKRRMSLSDVDPAFIYGDIDSRFNARISECMTAWIRYRFREGTDNLGTFYEAIGSRKTMDDLYAFRTPEHWLEGGVSYALDHPRLTLNASVGQNLQGEGQLTPSELLGYSNLGVTYANVCNTLFLNAGIGMQQRQMRDPTDPFAFEQNALTYYLSGQYIPVHRRYWTRFSTFFIQNSEEDPLFAGGDRRFDTRDEAVLDYTFGRKIGPKYLVEFRSRIRSRADENQDTYVKIERDFHDLVAGVSFGVRNRGELSDDAETAENDNFQVRFNVRFKPSSEKGVQPVSNSRRLYSGQRASGFERGS